MNTKSLLAITLTALTLIPAACTITTTKEKETGGGGSAEEGGSTSTGGTTAQGGTTSTTGGSIAKAGSTSTAGSSSVAGAMGVAGEAAVAGSAGNGGTAAVAGATGIAGAAGSTGTLACTRVDVTDDIAAATTWTSGNVYVIPAGSTVYVNATLTIQPGTVVKFGSGASLHVQAAAQLNAIGSATAHVVFTGLKDDSACGDTNGDASASQPSVGDWVSVAVLGNSSGFDYAELRYSTTGIQLDGSNQSVKHSVLTSNTIALDAKDSDPPETTVIKDNVFYGNSYPVLINGGTPVDSTNLFHNPALATQLNTFQAITVMSDVDNAVTWSNTEVAYALSQAAATYYVTPPAALTLAAGVVLKFGAGSNMTVLTGATVGGMATATFTSYKDDSKLGDSNGDGAATTAAADDWDGVRIITSTSDTWFTGANVLYSAN